MSKFTNEQCTRVGLWALFIFKKKKRSTVACRNGVAWMLLLPTNQLPQTPSSSLELKFENLTYLHLVTHLEYLHILWYYKGFGYHSSFSHDRFPGNQHINLMPTSDQHMIPKSIFDTCPTLVKTSKVIQEQCKQN